MDERETVFVYPGQGKQHVGMAEVLYKRSREARDVFEEASEAAGFNVAKLCFEGPDDVLRRSDSAQPALVTVQRAATIDLKSQGINAYQVAGHSAGEISASIESGAISFPDGVRLACVRGRWMEETKKGSMIAIMGLTIDEVTDICVANHVEIANINTENQIVIAGDESNVDDARAVVGEKGGKSIELGIGVPSHTSHMVSVGERLAGFLKGIEIHDPKILYLTDVTAKYVLKAEEVRDSLAKQVHNTVLWLYLIREVIANGGRVFYEIGPGRVQSGLIKNIDRTVDVKSLDL